MDRVCFYIPTLCMRAKVLLVTDICVLESVVILFGIVMHVQGFFCYFRKGH